MVEKKEKLRFVRLRCETCKEMLAWTPYFYSGTEVYCGDCKNGVGN